MEQDVLTILNWKFSVIIILFYFYDWNPPHKIPDSIAKSANISTLRGMICRYIQHIGGAVLVFDLNEDSNVVRSQSNNVVKKKKDLDIT